MKRVFILSTVLLIISILIPSLSAKRADVQTSAGFSAGDNGEYEQTGQQGYYDDEKQITLLVGGEVKSMTLFEYLMGVVAAEMPASFPIEALKAQAVSARTYTFYKMRIFEMNPSSAESHNGAELCADINHCKGYVDVYKKARQLWGEDYSKYMAIIEQSIRETDGEIMEYNNEPIAAVFHSTSAALTENASDIWGGEAPYLVSVESVGSEESPKYKASMTFTRSEFIKKFNEKYKSADLSVKTGEWFKNSTRTEAGSIISVYVGGVKVSGTAIRTLFGLNSANFTINTTDDSITFNTIGYGHGIGMSQYGARKMALDGSTYDEILNHYYTGITICKEKPVNSQN